LQHAGYWPSSGCPNLICLVNAELDKVYENSHITSIPAMTSAKPMKVKNGRAHQWHVLLEVQACMSMAGVREAASGWLAGAEAGEPAGKSFLPKCDHIIPWRCKR